MTLNATNESCRDRTSPPTLRQASFVAKEGEKGSNSDWKLHTNLPHVALHIGATHALHIRPLIGKVIEQQQKNGLHYLQRNKL